MIAQLGFAFLRTRRISDSLHVDSHTYYSVASSPLARHSYREAMFRYFSHHNINAFAARARTPSYEVP